MMDILKELGPARESYRAGDISSALEMVQALWDRIPEPRTEEGDAYLVIEYAVALALKGGRLDVAQRWASEAPPFAAKRHDLGEVEFLQGKVAFESGDLQLARENFRLAQRKSEGRILEGMAEKYRQLLREEG